MQDYGSTEKVALIDAKHRGASKIGASADSQDRLRISLGTTGLIAIAIIGSLVLTSSIPRKSWKMAFLALNKPDNLEVTTVEDAMEVEGEWLTMREIELIRNSFKMNDLQENYYFDLCIFRSRP